MNIEIKYDLRSCIFKANVNFQDEFVVLFVVAGSITCGSVCFDF